ncbi:hypothetical protein GCM10007923_05640 [Shinella yambaruensis]|uniref:Secreted protein n=1 Tax=Shinella yambaruensis TaxID=415996 RepID=A0ABQ5ZEZ9_9HYPH|nr:hypothetical protein GCM10007923_05640 [Shinella yambaruensis]
MARMSMLWKSPTFTFAMAWLPQRVTGPVHHLPEVPVAFPGARLPICRGRHGIPERRLWTKAGVFRKGRASIKARVYGARAEAARRRKKAGAS